MAAERDQVLDRRNVETEVARMADEGEAVEIASLVAPLVTLRPMRRADQPHLLVIADRRHFQAGPPGKIAYGVHIRRIPLEPLVASGIIAGVPSIQTGKGCNQEHILQPPT